jgi:hypothetical protein
MSPILLAIGSRLIPIVLVPGTVWPDEIFQKSATFAIVIAFGAGRAGSPSGARRSRPLW